MNLFSSSYFGYRMKRLSSIKKDYFTLRLKYVKMDMFISQLSIFLLKIMYIANSENHDLTMDMQADHGLHWSHGHQFLPPAGKWLMHKVIDHVCLILQFCWLVCFFCYCRTEMLSSAVNTCLVLWLAGLKIQSSQISLHTKKSSVQKIWERNRHHMSRWWAVTCTSLVTPYSLLRPVCLQHHIAL